MPTDKIKPPDNFPHNFQKAIKKGIGEYVLSTSKDKDDCLRIARKYRAFVRSIAAYPLHPLNKITSLCTVRTRIRREGDQYFLFIVVDKKINWDSALIPPEN